MTQNIKKDATSSEYPRWMNIVHFDKVKITKRDLENRVLILGEKAESEYYRGYAIGLIVGTLVSGLIWVIYILVK